jgi:acetyl-CoA C-acetyltransferase
MDMKRKLGRGVAVVGAGMSKFGMFRDRDSKDLFREGVFAVASGFYDMVLVGGVEEMSKRTTEEVAEGLALATVPYEGRAGFTFPGVFGALATAYFKKYGATREHLMNVTIKSHHNATLNPKAQLPFSIRDLMNAKIKKAEKKGIPLPQWRHEKEFLSDPGGQPACGVAHAPL